MAKTWVAWVLGEETGTTVSAFLQFGIVLMDVCGLKRTRFAVGCVPSVRCTLVVAASQSTIAILVFQRGLGADTSG